MRLRLCVAIVLCSKLFLLAAPDCVFAVMVTGQLLTVSPRSRDIAQLMCAYIPVVCLFVVCGEGFMVMLEVPM